MNRQGTEEQLLMKFETKISKLNFLIYLKVFNGN